MDAQDRDEEQCHEADALQGPSEILRGREAAASPAALSSVSEDH